MFLCMFGKLGTHRMMPYRTYRMQSQKRVIPSPSLLEAMTFSPPTVPGREGCSIWSASCLWSSDQAWPSLTVNEGFGRSKLHPPFLFHLESHTGSHLGRCRYVPCSDALVHTAKPFNAFDCFWRNLKGGVYWPPHTCHKNWTYCYILVQ